jgi:hypothetical protein
MLLMATWSDPRNLPANMSIPSRTEALNRYVEEAAAVVPHESHVAITELEEFKDFMHGLEVGSIFPKLRQLTETPDPVDQHYRPDPDSPVESHRVHPIVRENDMSWMLPNGRHVITDLQLRFPTASWEYVKPCRVDFELGGDSIHKMYMTYFEDMDLIQHHEDNTCTISLRRFLSEGGFPLVLQKYHLAAINLLNYKEASHVTGVQLVITLQPVRSMYEPNIADHAPKEYHKVIDRTCTNMIDGLGAHEPSSQQTIDLRNMTGGCMTRVSFLVNEGEDALDHVLVKPSLNVGSLGLRQMKFGPLEIGAQSLKRVTSHGKTLYTIDFSTVKFKGKPERKTWMSLAYMDAFVVECHFKTHAVHAVKVFLDSSTIMVWRGGLSGLEYAW